MTPRQALLGLHLGVLAVGFAGVIGKLALVAPAMIVFARGLFAVLTLLPFARRRAEEQAISSGKRLQLIGAGVLLCAHWLTFFQAVKVGGVAVATLGFASFPAFTVLLEGLLFRERIRALEWVLVGLVSVGLILVTPHFDLGSGATLGLFWGIACGLLFALLSLANRATVRGINPLQASLWQNATIAVCLLPVVWHSLPQVRLQDWLWLALLGVLCTGIAHSLFVASLRVLKARTAAVAFALEPLYGIALAWWLFAEQPSPRMLLGGALILLATFLSARQGH